MHVIQRLLALALLAAAPRPLAAEPAAVPPGVVEQLHARFPGATVLASAECALGVPRARSYAALLQSDATRDQTPLRAAVAVADGPGWKVTELDRWVRGTYGSTPDFLSGYWGGKKNGYTGKLQIRCTSPKTDPDMGPGPNGELLGFAKKLKRDVRHVCFTTDDVYNSWACWTVNPGTSAVEPSFVQFYAD